MCCNARGLSRFGVLWGLVALATLLICFVSGSWLYTKEPITLNKPEITTTIHFRIGLWRVCPTIKKINSTTHMPSPACSLVKYSGWTEIKSSDLGVSSQLDLAPIFITRMRSCTVLTGCAVVLLLLACFFALLGHCNNDNKTLVACGLFVLGALLLGTGLVVFASSLSETMLEATQYNMKESLQGPNYDYRYGWCFITAGAAFIMTKIAAVFSLTGYLNRFPSVDEMVRIMVPGAERKLREHQRMSDEYLEKHLSQQQKQQYDVLSSELSKYESECGPLLNKTPPDVCTTNKCMEFGNPDQASVIVNQTMDEHNFSHHHQQQQQQQQLAGQTIPITIKNHHSHHHHHHNQQQPQQHQQQQQHHHQQLTMCPNKYGTLPYGGNYQQSFFAECGSSSSNSSSGYCGKSKTLQHQRPRKKCVKIETFKVPDATNFADFGKRSNTLAYSGSAV